MRVCNLISSSQVANIRLNSPSSGQYSLAVYWKGDDDLEYFTLRCRNEEQLKLWESTLNRLIQEVAARRTSDRNVQSRLAQVAQVANSTNPAPSARQTPFSYTAGQLPDQRTMSMFSQTTSYTASTYASQPHPYSSRSARYPSTQISDEQSLLSSVSSNGPQGYPPYNGFDDVDPEDDYEDYPPTASVPSSGRGTPLGSRRSGDPAFYPGRSSGGVSPLPPNVPGSAFSPIPSAARPPLTRSSGSHATDSSFGAGVPPPRGALRSQFSSNKLRTQYDNRASGPSPQPSAAYPASVRSRSASQPSAYVARSAPAPPPLPSAAWPDRADSKRGSGSSQSTQPDSSDGYSPHTSSPITPYGSSDSSLANGTHGRYEKVVTQASEQLQQLPANVKVKVHFHEDIFVIAVSRNVEYEELVERVGKKIRLCGPRRDDGPLRVKYKDEDGDLVSLGSTEDVQMAFESMRPGSQVTLFVQ